MQKFVDGSSKDKGGRRQPGFGSKVDLRLYGLALGRDTTKFSGNNAWNPILTCNVGLLLEAV
jgi:hypothetical protein